MHKVKYDGRYRSGDLVRDLRVGVNVKEAPA
jgi:hypothetical protein